MRKLAERYPILCVLVLMLLALSPAMALRDFTPSNELRYASIVDEAISDGHVFAFTSHGETYADKPPLYFWLMMLLKRLFGGHNMLALSLLSFIPACGIICVMDKWLRAAYPGRFSPGQRAGAAMMLATSGLFLGLSVVLRMDMLMCLWIVLALWTFWRLDHGIGRERLLKWMLPVYIFLALFTKGPVGLLAPPLCIAVYLVASRRGRDLGRYLGLRTWGVIAALSAVWIGLAWAEGGSEYINNLLFHQTVGRAVNAFHHKEPIWYYCWMIWCVLAPWCLLSVPASVEALARSRDGREPSDLERLMGLSCITIFLMLSLFSSKLSVYLAPLFPLAVYSVPPVVERRGWHAWRSVALAFAAAVLTLGGIGAIAAFVLARMGTFLPGLEYPFLSSIAILLAGVALFAGGIKAFALARQWKQLWHKPVLVLGASLLIAVSCASIELPQINDYLGYKGICELVQDEGQVYTLWIRRPENMDVYLGREVTDLGKDIDALLELAPDEGTLLLPASILEVSEPLQELLRGHETSVCGPYAAVKLKQ